MRLIFSGTKNITEDGKKVIEMIARGGMNSEIAEEFSTTEQVVKNAVGKLCDRFGAVNRANLVARAYKWGILK